MRLGVDRRVLLVVMVFVVAICAGWSGVGSARADGASCANEQLRAEQPYGLGLPDCRAYEMVSPVDKSDSDAIDHGSCLGDFLGNRASVSGDAIAFNSPSSFADPVGTRDCNTYISSREPGGWSAKNITPLHVALEGGLGGLAAQPFRGMYFTPDLSEGILTEQTEPLTSDAPKNKPGEYFESIYMTDLLDGTYRLMESEPTIELAEPTPQPVGVSSDFSRVLLQDANNFPRSVYEWVDGKTIQVAVDNNGEPLKTRGGSGAFDAGTIGNATGNTWHAMSSDGKRVFMTSDTGEYLHQNGREFLYMRENPEKPQSPVDGQGHCTVATDACTVDIAASRRTVPDPNGPYPVKFWGASANGSKAFFSSRMELTEDANTGPADNRPNLYEYDVESKELKDLTVDETDPYGAALMGVVEISEDGSYVYFVAKGKLAGGATAGEPNLYVSRDSGAPKFITILANSKSNQEVEEANDEIGIRQNIEEETAQGGGNREGDARDWAGGQQEKNSVALSMDGTKLAFLSEHSLTGYDNELSENTPVKELFGCSNHENNRCYEVYLYDASSGSLTCVSCNSTGARPLGPSSLTQVEIGANEQVRPRNFSDDGSRLFFQTADALVPHDSNGLLDVYEYEGGHVYPVSNVAGGFQSQLLDASSDGGDVFIATSNQLLPQDRDLRVDIYDARAGGGFPVTGVPPVCSNGDSCKPPPTARPGVFGAPASATFSGAGNLAPIVAGKPVVKEKAKSKKCKRGFVRKRGRCVKQKAKRSGKRSVRGRK